MTRGAEESDAGDTGDTGGTGDTGSRRREPAKRWGITPWLCCLTAALGSCGDPASTSSTPGTPVSTPAECITQCAASDNTCPQRALSDFPDFESARKALANCPYSTVAGTCAGGARFLSTSFGFGSETQFFDVRGTFVGFTRITDVLDRICGGRTFWPRRFDCPMGVVDEVLCGTALVPGDPFVAL